MIALPRTWISVGNAQLWGDAGTYQDVPAEQLPPIGALDGSFSWLRPLDRRMEDHDRMTLEGGAEVGEALRTRAVEATKLGLTVPSELATLLTTRDLFARIPTATACYFDIGTRLVEIPDHGGPERLLRFMNDQQVCMMWYLLLEPGGTHRVVVAAPEWLESDEDLEEQEEQEDMSLDDAMRPTDLAICESSFEAFIKRFWIENMLWYATQHGYPPIEGELKAYAEAVAAARAGRAR